MGPRFQGRVVVIGAGIAGLAATLAFAREGHSVTLVEKDGAPPPPSAEQSFLDWDRPGVPQRRLVHGFLPLARRLLTRHLPDVVERLLAAGAHQVDQLAAVPGRRVQPGDEDLFVLRSRRTVFEWVLRREVDAEPRVGVVLGDPVVALEGGPTAIRGVRLHSGARLEADLVIDAGGRSSNLPAWLAAIGAEPPVTESERCGLVYFSRFYRHREDRLPAGYQGALGYANAAAAGGDGNTFSLTFFARIEEPGLRLLHDEEAFERAVAAVPGFAPWHQGAVPLGGVNAMGALRNSIRRFDAVPAVAGLIPIGDSLSHTNPSLGRGMSLGLDHAFRAAAIDWKEAGHAEGASAYLAAVLPSANASYSSAVALEDVRRRLYAGDRRAADEPLGIISRSAPLAAAGDQELYRALLRNTGLLDEPDTILAEAWVQRARRLLAEAAPRPPAGPDLETMLAILEGRAPAPGC